MISFQEFLFENWFFNLFKKKPKDVPQPEPSNQHKPHSIEHFLKWHEDRDPEFGTRIAKTVKIAKRDPAKFLGQLGEPLKEYRDHFGLASGSSEDRSRIMHDKMMGMILKYKDYKKPKKTK